MSEITLGIIGGGQLGSMLAISAKKLNVKTVVYCDDPHAPAQNFCNNFISANYDNKEKIIEFVNQVDLVTYEFENIPFETLNEINKLKTVLPKPSVNRLIQHMCIWLVGWSSTYMYVYMRTGGDHLER